MAYIKSIVSTIGLPANSQVIFKLSNGTSYTGKVVKSSKDHYFIALSGLINNDKVFCKLGLNAKDFVKKVVGYSVTGMWPEVHTLEDLQKILDALLEVNKPEEVEYEEIESEEIEEIKEKPVSSSEYDWLF